jgi:3-deoxy-manno-octulosonate cytidylyltransferase (CMP-KDO synthetase)
MILGIIPARYASTRFPGKPLVNIDGKPMIQRVYEQALKADLDDVVIATDDNRIAKAVRDFGGHVVLTSENHPSGTDRCAEALQLFKGDWTAVVNIQGDEPYIQPSQINAIASLLKNGAPIATLVKKIDSIEELTNINSPKVVLGNTGHALYFSRQPIPFQKGIHINDWLNHGTYYKHIGIYGYQSAILPQLTQLKQGVLEMAESLEQLRWLENGYIIRTAETTENTVAIDTPEDLSRLKSL